MRVPSDTVRNVAIAVLLAAGLIFVARAADTPPPPAIAPSTPAPSATPAPAATPTPAAEPAPAAPVAKADPAAIEPLAFMAGCWEGTQDGIKTEECWLAPSAGLMLGMHRDILPSGKATFEFLRIEALPTGVAYLAQPRGQLATPFALVTIAKGRVEFSNPMHDYPRRIVYWADGHDKLKAVVEGPSRGKTKREEWTWTRRK